MKKRPKIELEQEHQNLLTLKNICPRAKIQSKKVKKIFLQIFIQPKIIQPFFIVF